MQEKTPIILAKSDFHVLKNCVAILTQKNSASAELLSQELKAASIVDDAILPKTCVRLNSTIRLREWPGKTVHEFSIVTPEAADEEKKMISVLDPWGAAFIGLSKTEKVDRELNGYSKCFEIIDVRPLTDALN